MLMKTENMNTISMVWNKLHNYHLLSFSIFIELVHICLNIRRHWYHKFKYCRLGLFYWTVNPYARSLFIHIINIQNTTRNLQTHNMTETNCKKWTFYSVLELQNRLDKKISSDVSLCKNHYYMVCLSLSE